MFVGREVPISILALDTTFLVGMSTSWAITATVDSSFPLP